MLHCWYLKESYGEKQGILSERALTKFSREMLGIAINDFSTLL